MIPVPHSRPTMLPVDFTVVQGALSAGHLADGVQVGLFEQEFAKYLGMPYAVATNSGTNALHLALLALGIAPGDEVIMPSYVCIALLNAASYVGGVPRLVDCSEGSSNISASGARGAITPQTKAIIAPHMFGDGIADIEELCSLGVPVIEDCALSIGATIGERRAGSFADLTVCSFYATKMLSTGHGGMLAVRTPELHDRLRDLTAYDNRAEYRPSYNYRLTDFQAALGRSQLAQLPAFLRQRKSLAERFNEAFINNDAFSLPARHPQSAYFRYIVETDDPDRLIARMEQHGVHCRRPIFRPLHEYIGGSCPNATRAFARSVSIPLYPSLRDEEVSRIVQAAGKL